MMHALGQLSLYEFFLLLAALSSVCMVYAGCWAAWCWIWDVLWATGPKWLVSPPLFWFLSIVLTGLAVALALAAAGGD